MVVLVVATPPTATHSVNSVISTAPVMVLLFGPLGFFLDAGARSGVDAEFANKVRTHVDLDDIEGVVAQSFIEQMRKGNCFRTIETESNRGKSSEELLRAGYGGIIRLSVIEVSIRTFSGDYAKVHAVVHGQMEDIHSGDVVWDREERVSSPEPHPISFFEEHGLKDLKDMLKKASERLANDFVYR